MAASAINKRFLKRMVADVADHNRRNQEDHMWRQYYAEDTFNRRQSRRSSSPSSTSKKRARESGSSEANEIVEGKSRASIQDEQLLCREHWAQRKARAASSLMGDSSASVSNSNALLSEIIRAEIDSSSSGNCSSTDEEHHANKKHKRREKKRLKKERKKEEEEKKKKKKKRKKEQKKAKKRGTVDETGANLR